jgi:hypothetical protein
MRVFNRLEVPERAAGLGLGHVLIPGGKTRFDHAQHFRFFVRQIMLLADIRGHSAERSVQALFIK